MYKGIITPIVTPFHRDEEQSINYEAASDLIEYVISHGVAGIFVLGSNGEFHVIDKKEKIEFTRRVVEMVDHRVPVFAGPGACSTQETVQMAVEMEKAGVDALSVIAPYFIQPSQQELYEHFATVARSVHIPVILYNIPRLSGVNISREVFEQLSLLDNIAGIKDSSRDLENLQGYIEVAKKRNLSVLIGSDGIIAQGYRMGASGAIAGMSNVIPEVLCNLFQALKTHDDKAADELQKQVDVIRSVNKLATMPAVLKRALELAGIAEAGPARKPGQETNSGLDAQIMDMLRYYQLVQE